MRALRPSDDLRTRDRVEPTPPADRLGALDGMFLALEHERQPMHIALTVLVEGTLDRDALHARLRDAVGRVPKLRQRLTESDAHPAWRDDPHFDISNHVRFETLAAPGTDAMLRNRIAAFHAERIDREHPLWRALVLDGIENDRTALVLKVHHACLDGIVGLRVLEDLFDEAIVPPATDGDLTRVHEPRVARAAPRFSGLRASATSGARGLATLLRIAAHGPPRTALTQLEPSAARAFAWTSVDLDILERIARGARGTVNDTMLAVIAGGLRRWLIARGDPPPSAAMRIVVPVSLHTRHDHAEGNKVAVLFVPLPVDEEDPRQQLERVIAATRSAKASHQVEGIAWGEQLADRTSARVLGAVVRAALRFRIYDLIVTNVPGPTAPMSLLGARVVALYPLVPLVGRQAMGIALVSYAGRMYIGINIDPEHIDDGDALARAIEESFVRHRIEWLS